MVLQHQRYRTFWVVVIHVMLWALLGFVLLFYPPLTWDVNLPLTFWIKQIGIMLFLLVIFYANYWHFTPSFLFRSRYAVYFLCLLGAILIGQLINHLLNNLLSFAEFVERVQMRPPPRESHLIDGFILMLSLLVLGISTAVAAVLQWQKDAHLSAELQKQQIAAELSFLKAQINPHFFFNTLNNIYSLSFSDVELSREALHKLSRMMRYLLYETQQNEASLKREIAFLQDHIELMCLRLHENNQVRFVAPGLETDHRIAPMLLLPFVENALKHGISAVKNTLTLITLKVQEGRLSMMVENDIVQEQRSLTEHGGIGLQNTKRRLELLYPGHYTLSHHKDARAKRYVVHLTMELS